MEHEKLYSSKKKVFQLKKEDFIKEMVTP